MVVTRRAQNTYGSNSPPTVLIWQTISKTMVAFSKDIMTAMTVNYLCLEILGKSPRIGHIPMPFSVKWEV